MYTLPEVLAARHVCESLVQIDRQKVKLAAFCAMRDHAQAMRALSVASALQLAQRPVPALIAIAALTDVPHELWKLLAWRAWRSYVVRRMRMQALAGIMVTAPASLLLRRAMHVWTSVIATGGDPHYCRCSSSTRSSERSGFEGIVPAYSVAAHAQSGVSAVVQAGAMTSDGEPRVWGAPAGAAVSPVRRVVAFMPPLWKEALEKRVIMEEVSRDQVISSSRLRKRIQTMLSVKVRIFG